MRCFQSKIIRDTIEQIYQTPLRLLGNFGEQQLKKQQQRDTFGETLEDIKKY